MMNKDIDKTVRNLNLTLIQADIQWHDIDANLIKFGSLISSIKEKTDLILLPEMFNTGFTMTSSGLAEDMNGKTISMMKEWSRTSGADIAGSIIIDEGGSLFNRIVWVKPSGEIFTYDKRHLFRMTGEEKIFSSGNSHLTVTLNGWRIRPFICYDLRFPVWTRNTGIEYDLAIFIASWPASRILHWETLLRARAIENLCYTAGVNRTGTDGNGTVYDGRSCVTDFSGNTFFIADHSECIKSVELSYSELIRYRESFPAWMDADSFNMT